MNERNEIMGDWYEEMNAAVEAERIEAYEDAKRAIKVDSWDEDIETALDWLREPRD